MLTLGSGFFLTVFFSCYTGFHDSFPDRLSAKVAAVGCLMATMALKIKTLCPKRWVARHKLSPNLGRQQCIWAELHEIGGLSATLAVNRQGRCRHGVRDGGQMEVENWQQSTLSILSGVFSQFLAAVPPMNIHRKDINDQIASVLYYIYSKSKINTNSTETYSSVKSTQGGNKIALDRLMSHGQGALQYGPAERLCSRSIIINNNYNIYIAP